MNKLKELESQWLKEGGRVRWTKIPEIIVWSFRLANDALKIAKTGSLTKDGPSKTGNQRKNQVYSVTNDDVAEMGLKAVSARRSFKLAPNGGEACSAGAIGGRFVIGNFDTKCFSPTA